MPKAIELVEPKTNLDNETPEDNSLDPWENHVYTHVIKFLPVGALVSPITWSVSGNLPEGLSMDNLTGTISGKLSPLDGQPGVTSGLEVDSIPITGEGCENLGRVKDLSITFSFTIKANYTRLTESSPPVPVPEEVSKDFTITVLKNHDIDNAKFLIKYLETGYTTIGEEDVKHTIRIGKTTYSKDNIDEFMDASSVNFIVV